MTKSIKFTNLDFSICYCEMCNVFLFQQVLKKEAFLQIKIIKTLQFMEI